MSDREDEEGGHVPMDENNNDDEDNLDADEIVDDEEGGNGYHSDSDSTYYYDENEECDKEKAAVENHSHSKHALDLLNGLKLQKEENRNVDLEIKVLINEMPKLIPVHRCVVSIYCPYIKSYLDNMPESKNKIIDLTEFNGDSVMEIINWIYSGNCNLTEENAKDILVPGDFLRIDEVVKLSVDFLCDNLSFKNCSEFYNLSRFYSVFDFQKRVYDYIITNFYTLFTQHYLDDLSVQDIISFTSDDKLTLMVNKYVELNQSDCEYRLFEVIKNYLDRKKEWDFWPEFLTKSIRLGFLTASQIDKIIKDDNWLGNCKEKANCLNILLSVQLKQKFKLPVWNTSRKDVRVFKYCWSKKIARDAFIPSTKFNDLKTQLTKKGTENALVFICGIKFWKVMWDVDTLVIGGMAITYNDGSVVTHGLTEEQPEGVEEFKLKDGEYINHIDYRQGAAIDRLTFFTNLDKKYGPFGGIGGSFGTLKPKPGGFCAALRGEHARKRGLPIVRSIRFCWGNIDMKL